MIRSTRGQVTVCDRDLLIKASGGSYGRCEAEYSRLFSLVSVKELGFHLTH